MSTHYLDSLLKPASIALVGASDKLDSPGYILAEMIIKSGYQGSVYPVNPRCEKILGAPCYPDLLSLPKTAEHVVISLGNNHLEKALQAAIEHGARAATIYSSGIVQQDSDPPLHDRLRQMAIDASLAICGSNCMGFYNVQDDIHVGIYARQKPISRGHISFIAQSGSAFASLCHNGNRLGFNLCVSCGDEMTTTVADYMDWSLEQDDTRVIALFLETVRDPQGFVRALEKARARDIPVVVLKIGKSTLAAEMALTHTGAIAGNHAAFEALFKKYGVIEVADFDEMAAMLMLLQTGKHAARGKLAAVFESGGFRELFADHAQEAGIEFAAITEATKSEIGQYLDPGLKAENPLDAWGDHNRFEERFLGCVRAMASDPAVAAVAFVSNFRDNYFLSEAIYRVMQTVNQESEKPMALINCYSDLACDSIGSRGFESGVALIDGYRESLLAFRHLFASRDFKAMECSTVGEIESDADCRSRIVSKLENAQTESIGESDALAILSEFSIPVAESRRAFNPATLNQAATELGYPLVLKTAESGINHKSDAGGVIVGINNESDLIQHYSDLSQRLGPEVLLSRMVDKGVEIGLGITNDPLFGPIIMVAAGGVLIEVLADKAVALCPVNKQQAVLLLSELKISSLLDGVRGQQAAKVDSLTDIIVRLSEFAYEFKDTISEIDINPVIVNSTAAIAVDGLIILKERVQPEMEQIQN